MEHLVKLNCYMHRSFFNLIGPGVVMEGNRKMRGCLQTFGGHCMCTTENPQLKVLNKIVQLYVLIFYFKFVIHCLKKDLILCRDSVCG